MATSDRGRGTGRPRRPSDGARGAQRGSQQPPSGGDPGGRSRRVSGSGDARGGTRGDARGGTSSYGSGQSRRGEAARGAAGRPARGGTGAGRGRPAGPRPATRTAVQPTTTAPVIDGPGAQRLQKVLANAGVGSRRACEDLISQGRVTVDGGVAGLGQKVLDSSVIHVDGERIITDTRLVYLAMNKPRGVVSTMADERGREAVADYVGNLSQRVYHVGRLDADSEGLLLLTNDGTLAHRLTHPSYGVAKTYRAEVHGPVRKSTIGKLLAGVELPDGPVKVDSARLIDAVGARVLVEVTLHEGRKHIVRRLLDEVGHPVNRLIRTAIGPIRLGDLRPGSTRHLSKPEISALYRAAGDPIDGDLDDSDGEVATDAGA